MGQRSLASWLVVAVGIDKEAIVANRETGAQRIVPQVAGVHFIVGSIRRIHIGLARQQIFAASHVWRKRAPRHQWIGRLALGQRRDRHVDVAVHAFSVKAQSTLRVVDRILVLDNIRSAG